MNRLQVQYQRLYLPHPVVTQGVETARPAITESPVRALVIALRNPADWDTLAPMWRGVQVDLGWPAPAIAVNGVDAFELWFSLAQPVTRAEATAMLHALCQRYLAGVQPERLPCWPSNDPAATDSSAPRADRIPALHPDTGRWSAFVAPDLPAIFGDDPSLDFQPGEDAQAELLSRLSCIKPDNWQVAVAQLQAASFAVPPAVVQGVPVAPVATTALATPVTPHNAALVGPYEDPRRFLRDVMNESSVPLALRLEAAKILLG